jgi:NAD(P)-dependent dehydrogenase (short-subunit alcohol dehydrogenase family)
LSLSGTTIVITGASRGLGEAMAVGYAEAGAALVLSARTVTDLERVQKQCLDAGAPKVTLVPCDVTDEDAVAALVHAATPFDVFVANAGTSYSMLTDKRYTDLTTYDRDIFDRVLAVNVTGMWLCMKHALPVMQPGSSFIAIGSETGRALRPGSGVYAISKSTVDALATMAAREQAERKVRVNILSPGGMVDTQLFGPDGMPDFLKQMHPPLPADVIVPAALWLASDDAADVTGAIISGREFNADPDALKSKLRA